MPPSAEINFCRALAIRVYSTYSVNDYRLSVCLVRFIQLGLKTRVYILRRLGVISDCNDARVENGIRRARHKHYTHWYSACETKLRKTPVTTRAMHAMKGTLREAEKSDSE